MLRPGLLLVPFLLFSIIFAGCDGAGAEALKPTPTTTHPTPTPTKAYPTPTPTATHPTPTPRPADQGVHTPEGLRAHLEALPEFQRLVIDDDVQIRITPAWYETTAEWVGGAVVYHVPTMSSITLDRDGVPSRRDVRGDEARDRLEAVLADEAVMAEVQRRLVRHRYHPDWPVFQYRYGGGFFPRRSAVPDITIWGNGRVVFIGPEGGIREGMLDQDTVIAVVQAAMDLYDMGHRYTEYRASDLPTGSFTINTTRGRKTVAAYGFYPEKPAPDAPDRHVLQQLRGVYQLAMDSLPAAATTMKPDEVIVTASPVLGDVAPAQSWPSRLVGHLHGEEAREAARLGGVGLREVFDLDGAPHRVTVAPVVPLLHLPWVLWPVGGLPRMTSAIAYSAPGTPYRYDQIWPSDAARFYRRAMSKQGWRLVKEEEDALQLWVRDQDGRDPIVVLRLKEEHMEIELLSVENGVPRHPDGVLGGCPGSRCVRLDGVDVPEAEAWFREYLGYLGWEERVLRITYRQTEEGTEVTVEQESIPGWDWPAPPPGMPGSPEEEDSSVLLPFRDDTANLVTHPEVESVLIGRVVAQVGEETLPLEGGGMAAGRYKSWRVEVERYLVDPQPYSEVELRFLQHFLHQDGSPGPAFVPVSLRDGQRAVIFLTRSVVGSEPPVEDEVFTAPLGLGARLVRPLGVRIIEEGQVRTVKEGEVQREPLQDFAERLVRIARDAGRLVP